MAGATFDGAVGGTPNPKGELPPIRDCAPAF